VRATPLGDYLRSRRHAATPAQVGLPVHGPRRVEGLRREEVALLTGVSVDYYTRLEQGRERSPSASVLESLGRALALDDDGRQHLFRLTGLSPRAVAPVSTDVDPTLMQLLETWPHTPALVLGQSYDVLSANHLGTALFSHFPGPANLLHIVFLDPASRTFYVDWPAAAASTVAGFRLLAGAAPDEPRIREVLHELLHHSPEFTDLWKRHEARGKSTEVKRFVHPEVGPLTLRMHTFDVRSSPGQQLLTYHAEPDTRSAEAIVLLARGAATHS